MSIEIIIKFNSWIILFNIDFWDVTLWSSFTITRKNKRTKVREISTTNRIRPSGKGRIKRKERILENGDDTRGTRRVLISPRGRMTIASQEDSFFPPRDVVCSHLHSNYFSEMAGDRWIPRPLRPCSTRPSRAEFERLAFCLIHMLTTKRHDDRCGPITGLETRRPLQM